MATKVIITTLTSSTIVQACEGCKFHFFGYILFVNFILAPGWNGDGFDK